MATKWWFTASSHLGSRSDLVCVVCPLNVTYKNQSLRHGVGFIVHKEGFCIPIETPIVTHDSRDQNCDLGVRGLSKIIATMWILKTPLGFCQRHDHYTPYTAELYFFFIAFFCEFFFTALELSSSLLVMIVAFSKPCQILCTALPKLWCECNNFLMSQNNFPQMRKTSNRRNNHVDHTLTHKINGATFLRRVTYLYYRLSTIIQSCIHKKEVVYITRTWISSPNTMR